jgi:uncharacterized membrane protein
VGIFGSTGTYVPIAGVGVATGATVGATVGVVGVVGTTGAAVGTAVDAALGVADADAEAEVDAVVDAACDVLPAAWLLLVDDVQPATLTISTARTPSIKTIFNVIFVIYLFP